jgi:ABC-type phosphate transport system permease subunit
MNKNECRMERVSNVTVGFILMFVGLLFMITGITVLPIIGLMIAVPVLILAGIFLVSPRSKACAIIAQKTRGALKG